MSDNGGNEKKKNVKKKYVDMSVEELEKEEYKLSNLKKSVEKDLELVKGLKLAKISDIEKDEKIKRLEAELKQAKSSQNQPQNMQPRA